MPSEGAPPAESSSTDGIVRDVEDTLKAPGGAIVIEHAGGSIRISTNDLRWWSELEEDAVHVFADALASLAEDGASLMIAGDITDEPTLPPAHRALRRVELHRRRGGR